MALLFPANPTNGQIYDQYVYDASAQSWRVYGSDTGINSALDTINSTLTTKANLSGATFTGNIVSPGVNWILFSTPVISEFSFTSTVNVSWTLNSSVPTNARYVLANVFATASSSDHQNFILSATQFTNAQSWVDTRGQQPSTRFGSLTQKEHVTLTYYGEADGYTSNYGIWYNSQTIPVSGRTVWMNNFGNSGTNGWLYFLIRGYSL
jgi:hypothetical protein